jgi:methionine-gamma-lyase
MDPAFSSLCVRRLDVPASNPPQQLPLFLSSSFAFEAAETSVDVFAGQAPGYVYSRYGNPTIDAVARRLADMEGYGLPEPAEAYMTSSGMAAIHVLLLSLLPRGGKVLTQANLYGGTTELFDKVLSGLGIVPVFADLNDPAVLEARLQADPEIRVVYLETPSNPGLSCLDLKASAAICRRHGCFSVADNTFCTPYIQRPLGLGVDFVIHSTTKYLNGHGTGIAGVMIGRDGGYMREKVWPVLKLTGATCNPFDAWMVAHGIRTLPLRMDRHNQNALALAEWLKAQHAVNRVNYPGLPSHKGHAIAQRQMAGFGGMLSFEVPGGREGALRVMNRLRLPTIAPTLGDVDTLILHPATSSHLRVPPEVRDAQGITEGLIRVSVGLEDLGELIADFAQALS